MSFTNRDIWSAQQGAACAYTGSELSLARARDLMQAALEVVDIFAAPDSSCLVHDTGSHVTK